MSSDRNEPYFGSARFIRVGYAMSDNGKFGKLINCGGGC